MTQDYVWPEDVEGPLPFENNVYNIYRVTNKGGTLSSRQMIGANCPISYAFRLAFSEIDHAKTFNVVQVMVINRITEKIVFWWIEGVVVVPVFGNAV